MLIKYYYECPHPSNIRKNIRKNFIGIIDTDFEDQDDMYELNYNYSPPDSVRIPTQVSMAIINVYEKRKLNVAANLLLALNYIYNICHFDIKDMIKDISIHNPKFKKYEKDVEKYLVLL